MIERIHAQHIIYFFHDEFSCYTSGQRYYHKDGKSYEHPKLFPAVLFDDGGYIKFGTERTYKDTFCRRKVNLSARTLNFSRGINSLPGYVQCDHSHEEELKG